MLLNLLDTNDTSPAFVAFFDVLRVEGHHSLQTSLVSLGEDLRFSRVSMEMFEGQEACRLTYGFGSSWFHICNRLRRVQSVRG